MPIIYGTNTDGCFVKWGDAGKKYYYTCGNEASQKRANEKAQKQAAAIKANR